MTAPEISVFEPSFSNLSGDVLREGISEPNGVGSIPSGSGVIVSSPNGGGGKLLRGAET